MITKAPFFVQVSFINCLLTGVRSKLALIIATKKNERQKYKFLLVSAKRFKVTLLKLSFKYKHFVSCELILEFTISVVDKIPACEK